ncbi:Asp23/Gls24 family envelope stress response protein [Streptomyces sp. WMMB303]|uniref:Asp23/Gls24 family envelope stress response protein n=1 Tax=Streptomyces sp. WMMB303 TaxID=3034154 RepID=UPI0023ECF3B4|nr:Asp23/Gls24 family envelope stress response protein [Streptomyces sp. WMMB303]MDF4254396.1 Asp23/Gls24 family envelope stress response protein [Streptomyces sp. WMMB303]
MTSRIHPPASPPPPEPPGASDPDDELLPCGRLLSQVWADWEEGTSDGHERTCPHCRRAVEELDHLETAVRGLHDEADDPVAYDAAPLTQRVMDIVRVELRPGRPLPLAPPPEDLWIMETAAARTLRAAAEQVPGVRAGSCRIAPESDSAGRVSVRLGIQVLLSVSDSPELSDLPGLADAVRLRVERAADRYLGLRTVAVDVRVTDLVDADAEVPGSDPANANAPDGTAGNAPDGAESGNSTEKGTGR